MFVIGWKYAKQTQNNFIHLSLNDLNLAALWHQTQKFTHISKTMLMNDLNASMCGNLI